MRNQPRATIEERGLRVRSSGIVSEREAELRQASKQVAKIRKSLLVATRELAAVQQVSDQIRGQATQLQQQQVGYSAQLANLNPNARNHTTINNKLVGMLNAISGQRELLLGQQGVVDNRLAKSRQGLERSTGRLLTASARHASDCGGSAGKLRTTCEGYGSTGSRKRTQRSDR